MNEALGNGINVPYTDVQIHQLYPDESQLTHALRDDTATKKWFAKAEKQNNLDVRLAEARYYIQINQQQEALDKRKYY